MTPVMLDGTLMLQSVKLTVAGEFTHKNTGVQVRAKYDSELLVAMSFTIK